MTCTRNFSNKMTYGQTKLEQEKRKKGTIPGIEINIMKELGKDPIISFYMLLANSKKHVDSALPIFDEVRLQSAFKEVFHQKNIMNFNELLLYRKLLLFKYSEQYATLRDLAAIMRCFDEHSIKEHFKNFSNIIEEWHQFVTKRFSVMFSRHAFNEILFEYTARYMRLYGHITDKALIEKAKEIQEFLCDSYLMSHNWLIKFNSTLFPRLVKTKFDPHTNQTARYLELSTIYEHIKGQLHFSVWETVNQASVTIGRSNTTDIIAGSVMKAEKITANLQIMADNEYILPDENDEEILSKDICIQLDSEVDTSANEAAKNYIEQYKKYAINIHGLKKSDEIMRNDLKKLEEIDKKFNTKIKEKESSNIFLSESNLQKYHSGKTVSEKDSEILTQFNNNDVITLDNGLDITDELMIDDKNVITNLNEHKQKKQKSIYSILELQSPAGQSKRILNYKIPRERFRWMIYYDFQCGLNALQCINRINMAFGNEAPSSDSINRWYLDLQNYLATQSALGKN